MKVSAGRLEDLPADHAVAVGDGSVVVVRSGGTACAFRNRCLHKENPLAGGRVHEGTVLSCPHHFWQYDLPSGRHLGGRGVLPSYPVEVTADGEVLLEVPDPPPAMSMRERLLAHARSWERGS
ncbi:MAG: Rieske (2Fe-2S) protein [Micrococcales bacterium]|nr:Rieske (2Fe-2S) protein [Micrococcales bacterium]